ncbi:hypothetical protein [Paludisphaera sp.]|uniref:hypothetical protein n=1 Tax=Paludisphaera sp. TaxID=2017432 RepID=UPI00301D239F
MMSFLEYVARRQKAGLPDPTTMLALLGVDPHGPHEIDVLRMVKDEKKRAAQAPAIATSKDTSEASFRGQRRSGPKAR